ncbi:sensor histidine kinase [Streptomyces sp. NPDC058290]|uniref:sensor histidine kinase n=1 Tax=Streptomyces sp. NPDC058290 TaxID=3346426 RepID=UPI0036E9DBFD
MAGWLPAGAVGLPVALRRRLPVPAAVTVLAALAAATLLDVTREPYLAGTLALYTVALAEPPRRSVPVLAFALAVAAAAVLPGEAVLTPAETWSGATGVAATVWLVLGAGWTAGCVVRMHRARDEERAALRTEQVLAEERLRIARELHDVVSHSLSLIAVQAGVARHVAPNRPQEALDVGVIEDTSRAAMTEMRRALGVLRAGPALAPAPGVEGLPLLAEHARAAGLSVDLVTRLPHEDLPAGLGLTIHRIVQEGLANAVKHAAPAHCRVAVDADGQEVRIEVTDDGRRSPASDPSAKATARSGCASA